TGAQQHSAVTVFSATRISHTTELLPDWRKDPDREGSEFWTPNGSHSVRLATASMLRTTARTKTVGLATRSPHFCGMARGMTRLLFAEAPKRMEFPLARHPGGNKTVPV